MKTHYRKVFKSDHLGVADLEDLLEESSNLVFTIKHVRQENGVSVAGRKGNFNIAYFNESIKPLVLNAGNSKVMKTLTGSSFVEDWVNTTVQLYIDPSAKLKGEVVGGVRIRPSKVEQRKSLTPDMTTPWGNAINAYKRDGNLNAVLKRYDITLDNQAKIMGASSVS